MERKKQLIISEGLRVEVDSLKSYIKAQDELAARKYLEAKKLLEETIRQRQNESKDKK